MKAYKLKTIGGDLLPVGGVVSQLLILGPRGAACTIAETTDETNPLPDPYTYSLVDGVFVLYRPTGVPILTGVADDDIIQASHNGLENVFVRASIPFPLLAVMTPS